MLYDYQKPTRDLLALAPPGKLWLPFHVGMGKDDIVANAAKDLVGSGNASILIVSPLTAHTCWWRALEDCDYSFRECRRMVDLDHYNEVQVTIIGPELFRRYADRYKGRTETILTNKWKLVVVEFGPSGESQTGRAISKLDADRTWIIHHRLMPLIPSWQTLVGLAEDVDVADILTPGFRLPTLMS